MTQKLVLCCSYEFSDSVSVILLYYEALRYQMSFAQLLGLILKGLCRKLAQQIFFLGKMNQEFICVYFISDFFFFGCNGGQKSKTTQKRSYNRPLAMLGNQEEVLYYKLLDNQNGGLEQQEINPSICFPCFLVCMSLTVHGFLKRISPESTLHQDDF